MAQLTIEIPDALLPELAQVRSQLPTLLTQWITASRVTQSETQQTASHGYEQLDQLMQMLKIRAYSIVHQQVEG